MKVPNLTKLIFLAAFAFCPSLFAVSYTWNFYGSGGSNCTSNPCGSDSIGNSMVFNAATGSPNITVKATAYYVNNGTGLLQKATLGRYSHGLGVCYPGEDCTNPNHQTDSNGNDEFVLLEFSSPVDPSTVKVYNTNTGGGDADASYWLGGDPGQNMNLTGKTLAELSSMGFGSQNDNSAAPLAQGGSRDVSILPNPGSSVSAMLFGAQVGGGDNDYFKIYSMGGVTGGGGGGGAVPEPSSVILLSTVGALVAFRLRSKFTKRPQAN